MTKTNEIEEAISFIDNERAAAVVGKLDENLVVIEKAFPVRLIPRGNTIQIIGESDAVSDVINVLSELASLYEKKQQIRPSDVMYMVEMVRSGEATGDSVGSALGSMVGITSRGQQVRPRTLQQKEYVECIERNDLVFGIGPAGTGKTFLAVAMAVLSLKRKQVSRIILTRPAVEAGEKLGFLPGDLQDKVDPYLRPLYDSMYDILGLDTYRRYIDRGVIEIAPLAYMRGRTLADSFIILDEAQNTTPEQMKMFLTRMGFDSRAVITGDITQIDLPKGKFSGLVQAKRVLDGVEGIDFVHFTERDVVRHDLVQRVIKAYDRFDRAQGTDHGQR